MAKLQSVFNAHQFAPVQGGNFQQLPLGMHPVHIVASEVKATADNSGGMLVFELEVIDGPNRGATGLMRINLYSSSDKSRGFAEGQMSALCHLTGVFMPEDTSQLHGKPFVVEVVEQPLTPQQMEKKNNGETVTPFTQVKKMLDMNCQEPKAQGQQPSQAPAPQQQAQAPAAAWGGGNAGTQAQAPAAAPAAGSWAQGGAPAAGGTPAWGKR